MNTILTVIEPFVFQYEGNTQTISPGAWSVTESQLAIVEEAYGQYIQELTTIN